MNIRYFTETDTLHTEFLDAAVVETRDLDENTLIDTRLDLPVQPARSFPSSPLPAPFTLDDPEPGVRS